MRSFRSFGFGLGVLLLVACAHAPAGAVDSITGELDDFHDAAAHADEPRYFGHFAPDGVFLGTDATERWEVAAFRAYSHPYFAGRWLLEQYVLSITVPNDRFKAVKDLLSQP